MRRRISVDDLKKNVEERISLYKKERKGCVSGNSRSKFNLIIGELDFILEDIKLIK